MRESTLLPLVEAILPSAEARGATLPTPEAIAGRIASIVPRLPAHGRLGVRAALLLSNIAPLLLTGRLVRFRSLPLDDRRALLRRWLALPVAALRDLGNAFRALTLAVFYDDPRVTGSIGWFVEDHIAQVNATPPVPAAQTGPSRTAGPRS